MFSNSSNSEYQCDVRGFSIGTYNLLHPFYAEKYRERVGIDPATLKSNWHERMPALGDIFQRNLLDVYLLQEIGEEMLQDLRPYINEYSIAYFTHPLREAQDGVAVLLRKERFDLVGEQSVPLLGRDTYRGRVYMVATAVWARDLQTGLRVLLVSEHFYDKRVVEPEASLLHFLDEQAESVDAI
eukprot:gene19464-23273_t